MHDRGRWFHSGGHGRGQVFERGDLKYVILELVAEKPRHGYDVIQALEERFGGLYAPSPGAVYPTLQMLEDMGCVTVTERDGKKVYQITDEGTLSVRRWCAISTSACGVGGTRRREMTCGLCWESLARWLRLSDAQ